MIQTNYQKKRKVVIRKQKIAIRKRRIDIKTYYRYVNFKDD